MKTDLVTSITAAVLGAVIAFFVCNLFLPARENVSIKTLENADSNYTLSDPNVDVFNFRALNPTVEVYVGDCTEYDENGKCKEDNPEEEIDDDIIIIDDDTEEESEEEESEETEEDTENTNEENTNGPTN